MNLGLRGIRREAVLVIVLGGIKQMVRKPRLMGDPAQHRKHQRQPPGHQPADRDQQHQRNQQADAFVAPMALEQLLFAAHGLAHTVKTGTELHQRSLYSRSVRPKENRRGLSNARACSQALWVLRKLSTLPGLNSRVSGSTPPLTYSTLIHSGASTRYTS